MSESEILYYAIIKKINVKDNNTTKITIPREAILAANAESDYYTIVSYSNRIEIRPYELKFAGQKQD
ncbi:hypothetical protein [Nitrosopumilus piranensis]|uniref:SpoVT-AbrB domain-containing protein n=1 Tax=Nitrosopumilus piranensis TaxID=1582439 RepID=A0A0C5BTJ7_9ARCH|nr:hypothetical protein [Nitrosopumilus piranensis]AJM93033.1 hypothetical protein NPIRD3C_1823 [Nitrosopumilus piranensis]